MRGARRGEGRGLGVILEDNWVWGLDPAQAAHKPSYSIYYYHRESGELYSIPPPTLKLVFTESCTYKPNSPWRQTDRKRDRKNREKLRERERKRQAD